ncbi:MAG: sigma-70 family RNA polymerase sigma factor [Gemmataceae bacterium]|nr:sigma-70 family RNA polymerase sigma factor [Gemmataceae bacterium]
MTTQTSELGPPHGSAAFDLIPAHLPLMRAVVGRFFVSAADRDDALQDATVAVARGSGRFGGRAAFGTWVYRVTCNACLMRLRADRRRVRREADSGGQPIGRDEDDGVLDTLVRQETARAVRAAIDGLPTAYREILTLRTLQELNVAECAARLGVSQEVVKVRSLRARRRLRERLTAAAD